MTNRPVFTVTIESATWPPILHSTSPYPRVALADAGEVFDTCWGLGVVGEVVVREGVEIVARFRTGRVK